MPVTFGNPGLLFGAFAAALPVIIHFLSRRRVRRVAFSDLRFLDQVQARQARRLGVRRWLLLLLRVLALLAVALAAAAPRWGGAGAGGRRGVLIAIDTSASMGTRGAAGGRFEAAIADARNLLAALPPDTDVQIVAAGGRADALLGRWVPAAAGADRALDAVAVGDGGLDTAALLREAARQVTRGPGPRAEVILVSDLQPAAVDDEVRAAAEALALAGEVTLVLRRVGEQAQQGGVLAVELPRRAVLTGETATIEARVLPARPGQAFTLELDGRTVAEAVADGPAGLEQVLRFTIAVPAPGLHHGAVRKESDAFAADDVRPFVLAVPHGIPVLVAHGQDRAVDGALGRGGWRVLAEALAPRGGAGLFVVDDVPTSGLTTGTVAQAALTVLVDPDRLGREAIDGLAAHLDAGGALLLVAGEPTAADYLDEVMLPLLGIEGPVVYTDGGAQGQRARVLDRAHPVLAGLPDESVATLEDVVWRRWFRVDAQGAAVPLALAGGDPLLVCGTRGPGRWALMPFHLRGDEGELSGSAMALPLLQRLAAWLARPAELGAAANITVGQELAVRPLPGAGIALDEPGRLRVLGPRPGLDRLAQVTWTAAAPSLSAGVAEAAGLAVFMAGRDTVGVAAVGLPASESDPRLLDAETWAAPLRAAGLAVTADLAAAPPQALAAAFAGTALAPWLLALAALLLAAELLLGRGAASSS